MNRKNTHDFFAIFLFCNDEGGYIKFVHNGERIAKEGMLMYTFKMRGHNLCGR